MWLQVLSLFYVYMGIYSRRQTRFRGARTGSQDIEMGPLLGHDDVDDADDQEQ